MRALGVLMSPVRRVRSELRDLFRTEESHAVQLWGITFVAALAGSFAAFFHRRSTEREAASRSQGGARPEDPSPGG
jgi:hypothetical protein